MTQGKRWSAWLVFCLVGATSGCGDDAVPAVTCGTGTTLVGMECIPAADACTEGTVFDPRVAACVPGDQLSCAAGTVEVEGECFPDGTIICSSGTSFDVASGLCIPDLRSCAEGTVEVDGACVPFDETLMATGEEGSEPNDWLVPGAVVPFLSVSVGGAAATLKGCFEARDLNGDGTPDPDRDSWYMEITQPTVLNVRTDGVRGASAAFVVRAVDPEVHFQMGYRFGVDLTSDGASRSLFLPTAGRYAFSMMDSRSLDLRGERPFDGLPAGDGRTCYFTEVQATELPVPSNVTDGSAAGEFGTLATFRIPDVDAGTLADVTVRSTTVLARPSMVFMRGENFVSASHGTRVATGLFPGVSAEGVIVVDPVFNVALDVAGFELTTVQRPTFPAPADGTTVTLPNPPEHPGYVYYQATRGDVGTLAWTGPTTAVIRSPNFDKSWPVTSGDSFLYLETGIYFVEFSGAAPELLLGITRTSTTPTGVAIGASVPDTLTGGANWYWTDLPDTSWVSLEGTDFVGVTGLTTAVYDPRQAGPLTGAAQLNVGAGPLSRLGFNEQLLVSVVGSGLVMPTNSYNFSVRALSFVNLGDVTTSAPATLRIPSFVAGPGVARVFAMTPRYSNLELMASPEVASDLTLTRVDQNEATLGESNIAGSAAPETLAASTEQDWVAFVVGRPDAEPEAVTVSVTATSAEYAVGPSAHPFNDVCRSGERLGNENGDESFSAAVDISALGFSYFGSAVSSFRASTNGWMFFDDAFSDPSPSSQPAPSPAAPNGTIAAFWDDLAEVTLCGLAEADEYTVQWSGWDDRGYRVLAQVILSRTGNVLIQYGGEHASNSLAEIGIENQTGTIGFRFPEQVSTGDTLAFTPRVP